MNFASDGNSERSVSARSWRRCAKPVLFRCLAVILPLVALESAARMYWALVVFRPAAQEEIQEQRRWHSDESEKLIPLNLPTNSELLVAATRTRTNNLGLRNDFDIDVDEPCEKTRILCIGDSVTFGYTVTANPQTYPAVLEEILLRRGIDCQVVNAGIPRFRIQHLVNLFNERLAALHSDIIIVLGGWNDVCDKVLLEAEQSRSLGDWIHEHIFLVRVVARWEVIPRIGEARRRPARISDNGYESFQQSLHRLIAASRSRGAIPVLCTLPHFHSTLETERSRQMLLEFYPRGTIQQLVEVPDEINRRIRAVSTNEDVALVDLSDIDQESLFADAVHPNDDGSAQIAERVAQFLLSELLVASE